MRLLTPWLVAVASLLPAPAGAQTPVEEAKTCEIQGHNPYYEQYKLDEWPKEAQRIKGNEQLVSRRADRLRLMVGGGKTVELQDCPYTDAAYAYLFERHDQAGRFYVISRPANEDHSYLLVMRKTGRLFRVEGPPIWTAERSKFLTVGCSMLSASPNNELIIHTVARDGFATEAKFPLPCDTESCSARWDSQSRISVTCVLWGGRGEKGQAFALTRNKDGAWNRSDR
jgi:hypothetical protein